MGVTYGNNLHNKKNYNSKTPSWTKDSVLERKADYDWFLTPDDLWNGNYNGATAYVHSSVRNFIKSVHSNNLSSAVQSTIINSTLELNKALDNIQRQVEPKPEWRSNNILSIFQKTYIEELFDGIKKVLLTFTRNSIRENVQKFKTEGAKGSWISITFGGEDPTEVRTSSIKTESLAVRNFKKYLKHSLNIDEQDTRFALIDSIGESFASIDWKQIDQMIVDSVQSDMQIQLSNGKVLSLYNVIQELKNVLSEVTDIEGRKASYDNLLTIQNLGDVIIKRSMIWKNMGDMYENIVRYARNQAGYQAQVIGTEELNKYNTTDILLADFENTIDTLKVRLGVSLKQTENFYKTSKLSYDTVKQWIQGDGADTLLRQYKYFMLNYMLLSDLEAKDRKMSTRIDDNIFSYTEIVSLYSLFNKYIGRMFLIQGLLGNLLNNTKGYKTFAEDNSKVAPVILVTQDYAVFTFDILEKMNDLLSSGDITIDPPIFKTPKAFRRLVERKREVIQENNSKSYADILHDSEVNTLIYSLNKSAFGSHDMLQEGQHGFIRMNTTINMASIVEKIGGYNRKTNSFF